MLRSSMNVARRYRALRASHLGRAAPSTGYGSRPSTVLQNCRASRSYLFSAHESSTRLFSDNSAMYRLAEEGIEADLDQEQLHKVIEYAKKVWPAPPRIPQGGWSSTWEHWPYLLTFYWFSPYFLMIPQIDMIANILYRLPGETRPILFSNSRNQFIFTLFQDPTRFFLYDVDGQTLCEFDDVTNEEDLVEKMDEDPEVLPLRTLIPDTEGEDAIRRVLERDETVVPLLAAKFLSYTPEITEKWQEHPMRSHFVSDQDKDKLYNLISEKVAKATEDGKTELTEEEQWDVMKQVATELDKRG